MNTQIQFLGGTNTVTGSKYLISHNGKKILIDCGLFQGLKSLRLKNWEDFPIPPSEIHAVILTHAHIDHSGYIPRLVKKGFRGKIYSTAATKEVCNILLPDSGYLMEEEAEYLNKKARSKHKPALPLFTYKEAQESLQYFHEVAFHVQHEVTPGFHFEFRYAGHILGAASVIITLNDKKIAFTGDVGRFQDPIFNNPDPLPHVDYLITESTYGNRLHKPTDVIADLEKVVNDTYARNGVVVIPAFAVGRAQAIMYFLSLLRLQNRIPQMPMYLNSPMATDFSVLFRKFRQLHKLSETDCDNISKFMEIVRSPEESKAINERKGPMLIISASGMLTGGRVLHHLKAFAPYSENTILLSGFQSSGTRGEALMNGAAEIKIHGDYVPVKAQVSLLDNISAHADYSELIQWFKDSKLNPQRTFITHGEPSAADEFRRRLTESLGWNCHVPEHGERIIL
ncbi:MAG: MBL fold metallo-hydrolase [Bdellovibrionaceae bacterium]|nr:MBL fold metallo-hydrolase [Pseudobdellovibrionaceae bacterium]